jgi:hypothetical protein
MQAKVIHLIKRVEQIDREISELHKLVDGIDNARSYRNTMKIAAEKQINDLVGERVKLMELKIENPPEFLTKHVGEQPVTKQEQPRIALETLLGGVANTTYSPRPDFALPESTLPAPTNPLKNYTRMMTVEEMLPKSGDTSPKAKRTDKLPAKTRAEILRDLPPVQY